MVASGYQRQPLVCVHRDPAEVNWKIRGWQSSLCHCHFTFQVGVSRGSVVLTASLCYSKNLVHVYNEKMPFRFFFHIGVLH